MSLLAVHQPRAAAEALTGTAVGGESEPKANGLSPSARRHSGPGAVTFITTPPESLEHRRRRPADPEKLDQRPLDEGDHHLRPFSIRQDHRQLLIWPAHLLRPDHH